MIRKRQKAGRLPLLLPPMPSQPSRAQLEAEIRGLKTEVNRLRDEQRDGEKMEDEVWIQDGRIWYQHRCNGVLLEQEISKGWKITSSGTIMPSFSCPACRAHFHATVIVQLQRAGWSKPSDWAPRWESSWATNWGQAPLGAGQSPAGNASSTATTTGKGYEVARQDRDAHGYRSLWDAGL